VLIRTDGCGPSRPGSSAKSPFEAGGRGDRRIPVHYAGSRVISRAAFRLHSKGTAISAVRGRPGLVLDEYLASLTAADMDWLGDDPVFLAAELCAAGIWEAVAGGYRVLDAEAVQVCADRVRELRERDANSARGPGPVGAAGTTRFGERNRRGEAVFRCARCTRLAAIVHVVRAGTTAGMGRPAGTEITAEGLVLDRFLGTSWHAEPAGILDAVQALIEQGNVDPVAIRAISSTLWDVTPFYCPECRLNYCGRDWDISVHFILGFQDCIMGICPNGHQHIVD